MTDTPPPASDRHPQPPPARTYAMAAAALEAHRTDLTVRTACLDAAARLTAAGQIGPATGETAAQTLILADYFAQWVRTGQFPSKD